MLSLFRGEIRSEIIRLEPTERLEEDFNGLDIKGRMAYQIQLDGDGTPATTQENNLRTSLAVPITKTTRLEDKNLKSVNLIRRRLGLDMLITPGDRHRRLNSAP